MSYTLVFSDQAYDDIEYQKKSGNKPALKKLRILLHELTEHPYTGTGQPEALKHQLSGHWSRRINRKDRLIYSVQEAERTVTVVYARGHYEG